MPDYIVRKAIPSDLDGVYAALFIRRRLPRGRYLRFAQSTAQSKNHFLDCYWRNFIITQLSLGRALFYVTEKRNEKN